MYLFQKQFEEILVYYMIHNQDKYIYIWIGTDANMKNLHACVPVVKGGSECPCTNLFGVNSDVFGGKLAQRLSRKLNKVVLCSTNLPPGLEETLEIVDIERELWEQLQQQKIYAV
eukprot:TRINITY_DN6601_c0_g1_i1.p3 TRINITY_DN6601_c0_g1~~TRINITY_DN6601_c0_g1_i1.p3  ORF type:complete len:115 (+),score=8.21 TRINITY_DN6601_c0_g1_i1:91-435(+)